MRNETQRLRASPVCYRFKINGLVSRQPLSLEQDNAVGRFLMVLVVGYGGASGCCGKR